MRKHHKLLSMIPIFGSVLYLVYICLKEQLEGNYLKSRKATKAGLSIMLGMLGFIVMYGLFALICNTTDLDLKKYNWLVITMFVLSGIIWNILFFLMFNRITKEKES